MNTVISDKLVKTRKRHRCRLCNEFIEIGEQAIARNGFESGEGPWTIHMHPECEPFSREWDCYDWEENEPGIIERPTPPKSPPSPSQE